MQSALNLRSQEIWSQWKERLYLRIKLQVVLWASQQQPHHKCRGDILLSILTNAAVNGGWLTKYFFQKNYTETADSMKEKKCRGDPKNIFLRPMLSKEELYGSWFNVTTT